MDSKRQDRQQGTGQTARDRTGIERKIEQDAEQDNTVMAGEGGLLSKIETGNANRSDGTGQEGQNYILYTVLYSIAYTNGYSPRVL